MSSKPSQQPQARESAAATPPPGRPSSSPPRKKHHRLGNLGSIVADRALGLNMKVIAYDPARDEERARLPALAGARPDLHWDCILFCAKEAVYKAWFPLTRRWLDFADLSVTAHLDGTFRARLRIAGVDLDEFDGRWVVGRGLVVAAISVSRSQGPRTPTLGGAA